MSLGSTRGTALLGRHHSQISLERNSALSNVVPQTYPDGLLSSENIPGHIGEDLEEGAVDIPSNGEYIFAYF